MVRLFETCSLDVTFDLIIIIFLLLLSVLNQSAVSVDIAA